MEWSEYHTCVSTNSDSLNSSLPFPSPPSTGPVATLAGAYHDVTSQRLEGVWTDVVSVWTARLVEVLPPLLENPQLRPLAQTGLTALSSALDLVRKLLFIPVDPNRLTDSRG